MGEGRMRMGVLLRMTLRRMKMNKRAAAELKM